MAACGYLMVVLLSVWFSHYQRMQGGKHNGHTDVPTIPIGVQIMAIRKSGGKLMMARKSTKALIVLRGQCNVELSHNRNITKVKHKADCSPCILNLSFWFRLPAFVVNSYFVLAMTEYTLQ